MLDAWHQFGPGGRVRTQLVGHHHAWGGTLVLEQLAHQAKGCPLASTTLQQGIKDVAICINRAPQPVFLSLDRHHHLIELPLVGKVAPRAPQELMSELQAELRRPFADVACFIASNMLVPPSRSRGALNQKIYNAKVILTLRKLLKEVKLCERVMSMNARDVLAGAAEHFRE